MGSDHLGVLGPHEGAGATVRLQSCGRVEDADGILGLDLPDDEESWNEQTSARVIAMIGKWQGVAKITLGFFENRNEKAAVLYYFISICVLEVLHLCVYKAVGVWRMPTAF